MECAVFIRVKELDYVVTVGFGYTPCNTVVAQEIQDVPWRYKV
jgi:hypothetical protein